MNRAGNDENGILFVVSTAVLRRTSRTNRFIGYQGKCAKIGTSSDESMESDRTRIELSISMRMRSILVGSAGSGRQAGSSARPVSRLQLTLRVRAHAELDLGLATSPCSLALTYLNIVLLDRGAERSHL